MWSAWLVRDEEGGRERGEGGGEGERGRGGKRRGTVD